MQSEITNAKIKFMTGSIHISSLIKYTYNTFYTLGVSGELIYMGASFITSTRCFTKLIKRK